MPNLNVHHFRSVGVGFPSDSELQKAKSFDLGTTSSATRALSSMNGRCLTNCPSLRCSNRKIHMPDTNLTPRFNNMVREIESEKKITSTGSCRTRVRRLYNALIPPAPVL
nr:hypothetical protein Iba_chr10dCG15980 [Ipomoea batatas]